MKLAVLGATGPTGLCVTSQALEAGHDVIAIVRDTNKMTSAIQHDNLKVVEGNIYCEESLSEFFSGCDAVMCCLGAGISFWSPITLHRESIKPITSAMRTAGVSRFICVTSWCTVYSKENPWLLEWFVKPLLIGRNLTDMKVMEEYLQNSTDINFTCVKPPGLSNKSLADGDILAVEGEFVPDGKHEIPRANVASFMLSCLQNQTWNNKMVSIALPK